MSLVFKFSDVRTIHQATKAFNRIEASGADRERLTGGRKYGRPQKAEDAFAKLIKAGVVEVVRRKFAPPLIKNLSPASGVSTTEAPVSTIETVE